MGNEITKTDSVIKNYSVLDNPYQGDDKKVLFVCSAGILRSATAARIYAKKYNTRCAGSESYALIPVTANLLAWANLIVFADENNYRSVSQKFALTRFNCEVVTLNIPDEYDHMHPELINHFICQFEQV